MKNLTFSKFPSHTQKYFEEATGVRIEYNRISVYKPQTKMLT